MDKVDLEPGRSQQHGATMGSNDAHSFALDCNNPYPVFSPQEPAPLRVSHTCEVEPDGGLDNEEDGGKEEPGRGEDTYVWFLPDAGSEGDGSNSDNDVFIEDARLVQGENARQLDVERAIDDLGMY